MDDDNRAEFVRRLRALADDIDAQKCEVHYVLKCDSSVRRGREEWKIEVRYR